MWVWGALMASGHAELGSREGLMPATGLPRAGTVTFTQCRGPARPVGVVTISGCWGQVAGGLIMSQP